MNKLVFVYGSLKEGFGNHSVLGYSEKLGVHVTKPEYSMYSLGAYPYVKVGGTTAITGEVYAVDQDTLEDLDRLEGVPTFYNRHEIDTPWGEAIMYVINKPYNEKAPVVTGVWEQPKWMRG